MITQLHADSAVVRDTGALRIVSSTGPFGPLWSVYEPDRPFSMKQGRTEAEALAKWFAANPVRAAA